MRIMRFLLLKNIVLKIQDLGDELRTKLGMQIGEMNANTSKFFKMVYINPPRVEG